MGVLITKILDSFSNMKAKILMLGLDAAGKTTILYNMKLGETVTTTPTIGFNVETVKYNKLEFNVWDIGGQTKIRNLWSYYFDVTDALIYVLDASDEDRINEAKETLEGVLNHQALRNVPVLVLANKMDMAQLKPAQLVEKMGLHTLRGREWNLQPTCALTGEGITEGF